MSKEQTDILANQLPKSNSDAPDAQSVTVSASSTNDETDKNTAHAHAKRTDYISDGFKNRTKGEAKFNFRTYVGLGYFGSLAASIGLTMLLRDSKWIWPKYQKITDTVIKTFIGNRTGKEAVSFAERIDSYMTIFSMFTATTLMAIVPIKLREDKKAELVKKYDEDYYGKDRVAHDPYIKQAHALIDEEPKQTWKSVIGSRIIAFGATMGVAALIGSNASPVSKKYGTSIDKMSTKIGRTIDGWLRPSQREYIASVTAVTPNEIARAAQPPDRLLSRLYSYLALDGLYTVMTSSVLFVFTRVLAPFFDKDLKPHNSPHTATAHEPRGATMPAPALEKTQHRNENESPSLRVTHAAVQQRLMEAPALETMHTT